MDRVVALVQSAVAAPFAGFGDVELFPSFSAKKTLAWVATDISR